MVSFKKTATMLLFARICECDAQKEHASTLVSTNAADNERSDRSLLLNLPDCSNPENHGKAQCICRHPFNAGMDLCKKWFEKVSVKSKSTIFSGTDTRIIGGSDVSNGQYPWFAKLTRGTEWAGCGGALVSPQVRRRLLSIVRRLIQKRKWSILSIHPFFSTIYSHIFLVCSDSCSLRGRPYLQWCRNWGYLS